MALILINKKHKTIVKLKNLYEMKKLTSILIIAMAMIIAACEGPVGPVGPPGEPGGLEYATIYEIEGDFTENNDHRLGFVFPDGGIYSTDVVLVYILWEVADGLDVWRLLPQTVVLKDLQFLGETDVLLYNFDYTYEDVQIFLEFTFPPEYLLPDETDNQIFRIAVVPADFLAKETVDATDISTILEAPNLELNMVPKIDMTITPSLDK